jgi:hypothetical protein
MRAILSFVRASLMGLACFAAFTAALCIAFSFAIAGPPTASEMAGARELFAELSRALDDGIRRISDDGCGSDPACADTEGEEIVIADAQPAEVVRSRPAATDVVVAVEDRRADPETSSLLGGSDFAVVPGPVERAEPRPRAERRASVADRRRPAPRPRIAPRQTPPPPLRAPSQGRTETLPAATDADSLAEIRSSPETRLRHPEPYQDEQPAYEAEGWEDEPYDEGDAYEEPAYEDDYERDPYDETW